MANYCIRTIGPHCMKSKLSLKNDADFSKRHMNTDAYFLQSAQINNGLQVEIPMSRIMVSVLFAMSSEGN